MRRVLPTPSPKVPALVRRGAAAAAVGIGLGGSACDGQTAPLASKVYAEASTDAHDGQGDASAAADVAEGEPTLEAGSGEDAGRADDAADVAFDDSSAHAESDGARLIVPPIPPPPPLPPPLPPK